MGNCMGSSQTDQSSTSYNEIDSNSTCRSKKWCLRLLAGLVLFILIIVIFTLILSIVLIVGVIKCGKISPQDLIYNVIIFLFNLSTFIGISGYLYFLYKYSSCTHGVESETRDVESRKIWEPLFPCFTILLWNKKKKTLCNICRFIFHVINLSGLVFAFILVFIMDDYNLPNCTDDNDWYYSLYTVKILSSISLCFMVLCLEFYLALLYNIYLKFNALNDEIESMINSENIPQLDKLLDINSKYRIYISTAETIDCMICAFSEIYLIFGFSNTISTLKLISKPLDSLYINGQNFFTISLMCFFELYSFGYYMFYAAAINEKSKDTSKCLKLLLSKLLDPIKTTSNYNTIENNSDNNSFLNIKNIKDEVFIIYSFKCFR